MGIVVFLIWFIGLFVSSNVYKSRIISEVEYKSIFKYPNSNNFYQALWYHAAYNFYNLPYRLVTVGKVFAWPIVLIAWVAQGRPDPAWETAGFRAAGRRNAVLLIKRIEQKQAVVETPGQREDTNNAEVLRLWSRGEESEQEDAE